MFPSNLHTHTIYSDGIGTAAECIKKAIELGFESIGISDHEPTSYNCGSELKISLREYFNELEKLKQIYKGTIDVFAGLECDIFGVGGEDVKLADYVLGSVHYLLLPDGTYGSVDGSVQKFEKSIAGFGCIKKLVAEYYSRLLDVIKTKPDILAHFDLVTKFNEDKKYFDPEASWYLDYVYGVVDELAKTDVVAEVNTGAISRGYRFTPYPHSLILKYMFEKKVKITISSDSHDPNTLNHSFDKAVEWVTGCGYREAMIYRKGCFRYYPLV